MGDDSEEHAKVEMDIPDPIKALGEAFGVIQACNRIVRAAIESGRVSFEECENYFEAMEALKRACGCDGIIASAFLEDFVDSWRFG